jgi:hypothetical protein
MLFVFLNVFLYVFHTALVLFNLFGWLFARIRRWNLLTLLLTTFSWVGMGAWHGWGYCICTDWHWQVRHRLGYPDDSPTFIHLLLRDLTGISFPLPFVYNLTLVGFLISLIGSVTMNIRDWRQASTSPNQELI